MKHFFPCCAAFEDLPSGMRPSHACDWMSDADGEAVPEGLALFDAHVHLFPGRMFEALWRWFDTYAWSIRYRLYAEQVIEFLQKKGVKKFCALHYAHKPGIAREMNRYVSELSRAHKEVIGLAAVYPGEQDARSVLKEAFDVYGLRGVKLHCHVQKMPADDPRMDEIYALCEEAGRPVVIHSGRAPASPGYGVDTNALCGVEQVERVLQRFPGLVLVVPHLGADEFEGYARLLSRYERLYLDTTMSIAGFFEQGPPRELFPGMASRLMYGTDFPNLPYAWDRELRVALASGMAAEDKAGFFYGTAERLFDG